SAGNGGSVATGRLGRGRSRLVRCRGGRCFVRRRGCRVRRATSPPMPCPAPRVGEEWVWVGVAAGGETLVDGRDTSSSCSGDPRRSRKCRILRALAGLGPAHIALS